MSRYQTFRRGSALSTLLESTFGRGKKTTISWNGWQTDSPLRKLDCLNHGGGVGATQGISERPSKLAPGRPVVAGTYLSGDKSASIFSLGYAIPATSIFPMGYAIPATGRPGLGVKSTVYRILGRPYQTKTKTQIRNPGNAYVGR